MSTPTMRLAAALCLAFAAPAAAAPILTGVNLAGAEFGGLKGVYGKNYIYPQPKEIGAFDAMGVNVFRIPVRWERLQPELGDALDRAEIERLDAVVAQATAKGISVIVDVHNYAKYRNINVGKPEVPATALADLWKRLATRYRGNPRVIFGLMNEPVGIGAADWAEIAATTVLAIRNTGATNLVLVPGVIWSGAHSWRKRVGIQSNAEAMSDFVDPGDNMAFDLHQYFDDDSSGTGTDCVPVAEAERRLAVATDWLRQTGGRGFLSEFAVSADAECQPVLRAVFEHVARNPQWLGWTMWASSAWFGTYPFNLYPLQDERPVQLDTMLPYLAR